MSATLKLKFMQRSRTETILANWKIIIVLDRVRHDNLGTRFLSPILHRAQISVSFTGANY